MVLSINKNSTIPKHRTSIVVFGRKGATFRAVAVEYEHGRSIGTNGDGTACTSALVNNRRRCHGDGDGFGRFVVLIAIVFENKNHREGVMTKVKGQLLQKDLT